MVLFIKESLLGGFSLGSLDASGIQTTYAAVAVLYIARQWKRTESRSSTVAEEQWQVV